MPTPAEGLPLLHAPLPDVTTERLVLRRPAPDDVDELAVVFAKPEVWQYPYGRDFTRAETEAFLHAQLDHWETCAAGCWIARHRESGRLLGYLGLAVPTFLPAVLPALEVGWRLDPDAWGHGYATEGASAALDQAFSTLGLDDVCSLPQTDNVASVRVAERLGMRHEHDVDLPATDRRGAVTAAVFRITAAEWAAR